MDDKGNIKKHYRHGFVTLDSRVYRDKSLTLKERGMIGTLYSLPDDWNFSSAGLSVILSESKNTVNSILHSLEKKGYLKRTRIYRNGKVADWFYDFYDFPAFAEATSQELGSSLDTKNEDLENQDLENEDLESWDDNTNTKESNKKKSNMECIKESDSASVTDDFSEEEIMNWSDDEFYSHLSDLQYRAFNSLLKDSMTGEIRSSKESLIFSCSFIKPGLHIPY